MPQVQWEQHQPVKSSPSTQIKRLFIHLPFACVWDSSSVAARATHQCIERGRWTPARRHRLFSTESHSGKVTKGLRPDGRGVVRESSSAYCGHITVPALTLTSSNAMATFGGAVGDGVAKSIVKPVGSVVVGAEPIVP